MQDSDDSVSNGYIHVNIMKSSSYHTVPRRGGRGERCDGDGGAQPLDHRQDAVGHFGGVGALVLPAAQLRH